MKYSTLLILFLTSPVFAQEFIPGMNLPPIPVPDAKYQEAVNKAVQAAYVQTGTAAQVSFVTKAAGDKATSGANATVFKSTPFKAEQIVFIGGITYAALVKKQVTKSFRNPLFRNVTNTISVTPNSAFMSWRIPF